VAHHRIGGATAFSVTATPERPYASDELVKPIKANGQLDNNLINDKKFIRDLDRLKELRSFLVEEAPNLIPEDSTALSLGRLNLLQYRSDGREPTQEEWSDVELHTQTLFHLLTETQRRRFLLGEIPSWIAIKLPISLLFLALAALICGIVSQDTEWLRLVPKNAHSSLLPFYTIWLMALGASGSVAFIGMNALSVQHDITFDLSNRTLMLLRITLGAVFGLVLTLPFGFEGFMELIGSLRKGPSSGMASAQTSNPAAQAMLLLLPFILGFSTSLVIVILNRLLGSVQAFFGRSGTGDGSQAAPVAHQSSSSTAALSRKVAPRRKRQVA